MKLRLLAAASAALGLVALSSAANAGVTIQPIQEIDNLFGGTGTPGALDPYTGLLYGQVMLDDFDAITNPSLVTYTGNIDTGPKPSISNSAPPPYLWGTNEPGANPDYQDPTKYASVQANQTGTFSANTGYYLSSFSFYLGSPDSYNIVKFYSYGNVVTTLQGTAIWSGEPGTDNGSRTWGYRVYYNFNGAKITKITFQSVGSDAMETDGYAGNVAAVPEPASWALMMMGFGGLGAVLRNRRRAALAVT